MDNEGNYRESVIERWVSSNIDTLLKPDEEFRVLLEKCYIQRQPIIDNGGKLVVVAQKK